MYPPNSENKTLPSAPTAPPPPPTPFVSAVPVKERKQSSDNNPSSNINNISHAPVPWSSGVCDCCVDMSTCCLTCWCPCITFGRIAEIVDRGSTSCGVSGTIYAVIMCLTGCPWIYSCFYRSKLKGQYFLEESCCSNGCCIHCFCEGCALCQEYRELKHHGFDLSIGWHGNIARQKRLATVPAAVEGGMVR